jgi:hypothetical protein
MKSNWWMVSIGVAVVVSGCGGDNLADKIVENRIESASGNSVDVDLSDGNFSVKTEDGSIEFNSDGDGNFTVQGVDGDGQDFSIDSNDGQTVVESDDGTATFQAGGDLPDGFPDLPLPDDFTIVFTNQGDATTGVAYMVVGTAPGDHQAYLDTLIGYLEANGYTQQQLTTTPDGSLFSYASDSDMIAGTVGQDTSGSGDGGMTVSLQIQPTDG